MVAVAVLMTCYSWPQLSIYHLMRWWRFVTPSSLVAIVDNVFCSVNYGLCFYYAHVYVGIIDHSLLAPLGLSMLGPASHSFGLSCASTVNGRCTDDLLQLAAVVYLPCDAVVAIRYTIIIGCYSGQCIFALLITVYIFTF